MNNNIKIGLFLLAFSFVLYLYLIPTQISSSLGMGGIALGARFFPRLGAILLGILSLGMVVVNIYNYKKSSYKKEELPLFDKNDLKIFGVMIILLVFINLFQHYNFFIACFVATICLLYYYGSKRHIINSILSISTTVVLYYLFRALGIYL